MRRFFRLFTLIWAAYFFLKALAYLWIAATLPLTEALALRSSLGSISLGADDRAERHPGPPAVFPVPPARLARRA